MPQFSHEIEREKAWEEKYRKIFSLPANFQLGLIPNKGNDAEEKRERKYCYNSDDDDTGSPIFHAPTWEKEYEEGRNYEYSTTCDRY